MNGMLLFLLVSGLSNHVDINALSPDNSEWIAPGYEIVEEIVIDPLDYGEPIALPEYEAPIVGCQPTFVQTPEGEQWRITLVLSDEVVVLQEDHEPVHIHLGDSLIDYVLCEGGDYILVRSSDRMYLVDTVNHTVVDAARINEYPRPTWVYWNGTVIVASESEQVLEVFNDRLEHVSSLSGELWGYGTIAASGSELVAFNADSEGVFLTNLDNTGMELSREPVSIQSGIQSPGVFSPDGSHILLTHLDGFECFNTETGTLVFRILEGEYTAVSRFSPGGEVWAVELFGGTGTAFDENRRGVVVGTNDPDDPVHHTTSVFSQVWCGASPVSVSDSKACLVRVIATLDGDPRSYTSSRLLMLDRSGQIVWISEVIRKYSNMMELVHINRTYDWNLKGTNQYVLDSTGLRVSSFSCYNNVIRIITLRDVSI